jgi:putative membrane protein
MELACSMVDWPTVLRSEQLSEKADQHSWHLPALPTRLRLYRYAVRQVERRKTAPGAYSLDEARGYLRHAIVDSVRLLRNGEALVVFPEAYPNIEWGNTPKYENDAFLPFRPGLVKLVEMVERDGRTQVAIVPAGMSYVQNGRWNITLRFGPVLLRGDYDDSILLVQDIEKRVRELSDQMTGTVSTHTEETIQL